MKTPIGNHPHAKGIAIKTMPFLCEMMRFQEMEKRYF